MNGKRPGKTDWAFLFLALMFLILALSPYAALKSVADGLASDGEMERFTPRFCGILKLIVLGFSLLFAGLACWGIFRPEQRRSFFRSVATLPGRCLRDAGPFFSDLRNVFRTKDIRLFLLLLILIAGTALRAMLINVPLEHDEAYSMAIWGRSDLLFAISDYHLPNNHVFHSVLINLIYHHLGRSVAWMRLPVLMSGSLLILAVWILGKLFYNEDIALMAAGMTAFAPFLISYSVNARGYEIQAFLSVLTVGLAVYGKRKRNIFSWFLLILLSGLNFFTLPIALYPFGGICVWLLFNCIFFNAEKSYFRGRTQLFKYLIFQGLAVSALSMLLYVPLLRYSGWNSFFGNIYIGGVAENAFADTMRSRLTDNVVAFTGTLPMPIVWLIGIGLILSLFVFRKNAKEPVSYGLSLLLWMALVIPFQKPNLWPRTLLFLHPFIMLFAASGFSILFRVFSRKEIPALICALFVVIMGVSQFTAALDKTGKIGTDERAVQVILDREGANAANIHFVTAAQDNAPIWMYADFADLPKKIFDKRESFNTVYALVNPLNDSYLGPKTLDDLLNRFGPGGNFMDLSHPEILMEESNGILYRFEGKPGAIQKAYGEYPEIETAGE